MPFFGSLPVSDPDLLKTHLNDVYRPLIKKFIQNVKYNDLLEFSNIFSLMCKLRDKLKMCLTSCELAVSYNYVDLLAFVASDFAEIHEEKAKTLMHSMLQNEISIFLQMFEKYMESFKIPVSENKGDKYEITLFEADFPKSEIKMPSGIGLSKALTEANQSKAENLKGSRGSYTKIYPTLKMQEESAVKKVASSNISFKSVNINFSYYYPSFL